MALWYFAFSAMLENCYGSRYSFYFQLLAQRSHSARIVISNNRTINISSFFFCMVFPFVLFRYSLSLHFKFFVVFSDKKSIEIIEIQYFLSEYHAKSDKCVFFCFDIADTLIISSITFWKFVYLFYKFNRHKINLKIREYTRMYQN